MRSHRGWLMCRMVGAIAVLLSTVLLCGWVGVAGASAMEPSGGSDSARGEVVEPSAANWVALAPAVAAEQTVAAAQRTDATQQTAAASGSDEPEVSISLIPPTSAVQQQSANGAVRSSVASHGSVEVMGAVADGDGISGRRIGGSVWWVLGLAALVAIGGVTMLVRARSGGRH